MSKSGLTLHGMFGLDRVEIPPDQITKIESAGTYAKLEQQLQQRAGPTWAAIKSRVPEMLGSVMNIDAADVLLGAWNKSRELRKYRDPVQYPPEVVVIAPLTKHKVRARYKPSVDVLIGEQPAGTIHFELDVELNLQGAELKIQAGRIRQIKLGQGEGTGTVKCEGAVLGQAERKLRLPGVLDLGEGVEIPD